ncbi:hypothetical protein LTR27_005589 [Elasticomyces elasticus]|nr:hypothetical protein LTR27_005589 [Elasticomyces elasticus]
MAECDSDRSSRKRERSPEAAATSNKRRRATSSDERLFNHSEFERYRTSLFHAGVLFKGCPALAEAWLGAAVVDDMQTLEERERELPDEDARIFWVFMVWLYTNNLVVPSKNLGAGIDGVKERDSAAFAVRLHQEPGTEVLPGTLLWSDDDLVELYIFCRRHHVDALGNLALSTLSVQNVQFGRTCSTTAVEAAVSAGHNAKLLFKYMIDEANWRIGDRPVDDDKWSDFNLHYTRLTKDALEHDKLTHASFRERPCRYHIHHGEDEQRLCTSLWIHKTSLSEGHPAIYEHLRETGAAFVGAKRLRLVHHKGLLLANANFFQGAFSGHFAESRSNVVELVEEDPTIFLVFVHWLYTGRVDIFSPLIIDTLVVLGHVAGGEASDDALSQKLMAAFSVKCRGEMMQLMLLCGLADRRGVPRLRNEVVDKPPK